MDYEVRKAELQAEFHVHLNAAHATQAKLDAVQFLIEHGKEMTATARARKEAEAA